MNIATFRSLATSLALGLIALGSQALAAPPAAFTPNDQPVGWVGAVAVSSFDFSDGGQTLFRTDYEKGNYSGNVYAQEVDTFGSIVADRWDGGAATALDAQDWDAGRIIVTRNAGTGIPFRWASMSTAQQDSISTTDAAAKDMVNYIRGQRTKEAANGGIYRDRTSALGDIMHSRPLFVPDQSSTPDPTNARLYVGGNDGMLHVFDACTNSCATAGQEVWAYIPSMLIGNLKLLTANPYVHQYFVDGSANARTVTISGSTKTILVGTLGAGGIGMYALDISDPSPADETAAQSKIKWEITNTKINGTNDNTYADLGYIYGAPLIVRLNDASHTWAAIVGNGYNSTGGGEAALLVINLDTGALIRQITTGVVNGQANGTPNGLSRPAALDTNNDGYVDYVYAGDISGNLWKFDLRAASTGSWPTPVKLFTNQLALPNTRAITGAPSIAPHPSGGKMITFGTGRIFTYCTTGTCDQTDTTQQYIYGVWDNDFPASGTAISATIDTSKLVDQTLSDPINYSGNSLTAVVRTSGTINAVDYTTKKGWRLALASGERVVGDGGYISDYRYQLSTANPNKNNGTDANGIPLTPGENWLVEVNFLTGAAPLAPFLDLNATQTLDAGDLASGSGTTQSRVPVARRISSGGVISQPVLAQLLLQSQTYFNINPDASIFSTPNNGGVTNGHFDFDIYYNACTAVDSKGKAHYTCPHNTHKHQYDDIYNVTGVDMLNASLPAFNLPNAITSTSTNFKILVANQKLSPAVQLKIGGAGATYTPVLNILTGGTVPNNSTTVASSVFVNTLTTYNRTSLNSLVMNMPLDAFTAKDWSSTGVVQVGLVPTQTGCVHANQTGIDTAVTTLEPYGGLWQNAALTIQLIKDTTPDNAIQLAVAGDPKFGYRLKADTASQAYQLAQYTTFWHHPNGKCYGQAGWGIDGTTAYPDKAGSATAVVGAAGNTDPKGGTFEGSGGSTGTGGTTGGGAGNQTVTQITLADGTVVTQTITRNADGSITITLVGPDGTTSFTLDTQSAGPQHDNRIPTGRISWKELIR